MRLILINITILDFNYRRSSYIVIFNVTFYTAFQPVAYLEIGQGGGHIKWV